MYRKRMAKFRMKQTAHLIEVDNDVVCHITFWCSDLLEIEQDSARIKIDEVVRIMRESTTPHKEIEIAMGFRNW